jgi:hypothetical protein
MNKLDVPNQFSQDLENKLQIYNLITMDPSVSSSCDQIVKQIKMSGLRFLITETLYKMEVKIRKKFLEPSAISSNCVKMTLEQQLEAQVDSLKSKDENLSHELSEVSKELFATKLELTEQHSLVKDLSRKLEENRKLTNTMKNERIKSKKEAILNKKVLEEDESNYEKVISELNEILRVKESKYVEEKVSDNPVNNDAQDSLPDSKVDALSPSPTITVQTSHILDTTPELRFLSISSQTLANQDVPYSITEPLPPIFISQLLHHTKPIRFLSRSLPKLDSICWGKLNDTFEDLADQAEEALNDQYDREIRYFYLD